MDPERQQHLDVRTAVLCTPHQTSRVCGPGAGVHTGPPGRSEGTRPSTPCSALLWPRSALHLPQCSRRLSTPGGTVPAWDSVTTPVSNPGPLCSCSVSPRRRLTRPVPSSGAVPGLGRPRWASSVAVRSRRSVSARLFLSHVARLWAKRVHVRLPASPGARGAGPGSPAGARPWSFRGARAPRPPSGGRGPRPCLPAWSPLGVFELPRHAGRSPQQVP